MSFVAFAVSLMLVAFEFRPPLRAAAEGTKWALLVGIDKYENDISPLRFSVADVKEVRRALVENAGFPPDNVFLMTSDAPGGINVPTHINVIKRLDGLASKVGPHDTFLLYFSGHGYNRNGRHFLATVNTDPASVETLMLSSIPVELLQEKLKKIRAHRSIFIIDACRNDPEVSRGDEDNLRTKEFSKGFEIAAESVAQKGEAGSAVFFACSEGERAYEWTEKGHGVFTFYLLEGLRGKAAEPTGALTMAGLADYVANNVKKWSEENLVGRKKLQTPELRLFGAVNIVIIQTVNVKPAEPIGGGNVENVDTLACLRITTNPPGAKVFVDDEEVKGKVTPCTIDIELGRLRTKRIEVAIELEGYKQVVRAVTLERGKITPLDLPLQREGKAPAAPGGSAGAPGSAGASPSLRPGATRINPIDGAEMVFIPAGAFQMGSNSYENGKPVHAQRVEGFWMYKYEVTVAQYRKFCAATGRQMPSAPSWGWRDDHPIVNVSWHGAVAYCQWAGVRLPTEAEWEYAARGGKQYEYGTSTGELTSELAHFSQDVSTGGTRPVGSYPANPFGLHDMAGNAWEWCSSLYLPYPYVADDGRENVSASGDRTLRGGAWGSAVVTCFAAYRGRLAPALRDYVNGFRCAQSRQ
jgi:formylglycine-generating enzyme required for sulfatase activity